MANYLYGGVELPDINSVWDKETYPYAYLFNDSNDGVYLPQALITSTKQLIFKLSDGLLYPFADCTVGLSVLADDEWGEPSFAGYTTADGINVANIGPLLWVSTDLLDDSGAVHMAATEPVKVTYEDEYAVKSAGLIATAAAIRAKTGSTDKIPWSNEKGFAEAVEGISTVITVASEDDLPTDADDGTIAVVEG